MLNSRIIVFVASALLFAGAGCAKTSETLDALADDAVAPVEVPLLALKEAQDASAAQAAYANDVAELTSDNVTVALVRTIGDDGAEAPPGEGFIGCGDQIVFTSVHRASASGNTVKDALATLLSIKEATYSGVYNALWQSTLTVEDVRSMDGVTTDVLLKGRYVSSGSCDLPRIKAQVERTIGRFRTKYRVILNGSEKDWRCMGDESGNCK